MSESQPRQYPVDDIPSSGEYQARWERSAVDYLLHVSGETSGDGRMIRDEILHPRMLDHLQPIQGSRILDAGCGDGILSRRLKQEGAEVFGGDFIELFVKKALQSEPPIPSTVLDFNALPYPNDHFDAIASNLVFMWSPEIEQPIREFNRVLKPGGKAVLSITHPFVNLGEFDLEDAEQPRLILSSPLQNGVWLKMINLTNGPYYYYQRPPQEYVNTFTDAGFHLAPGTGYEDVFFPDSFVEEHPDYLRHRWYPLFLLLEFNK